jgi:hypothetical protein
MITGFNTDIACDGQIFHIQTEDKGLENPIIETLVYTGGEIVCARKSSYAELKESGSCEEESVLQRMEKQHRELIAEIREGALSKEDLQPFGASVVSNRSFDEVVRSFLADEVSIENLKLEMVASGEPRAGQRSTIELALTEETTERPICGAAVVVKLLSAGNERPLFETRTDERGRAFGDYEIPSSPGGQATLVCEAAVPDRTTELRCRVKRARRSSPQRA